MANRIYRIIIDLAGGGVKVRAQSRSPRGTPYTVDSVRHDGKGLSKAGQKDILSQAIPLVMGEHGPKSQ